MKLAHRNYLGLNARRPVFGVYEGLQDSTQPAQLQRVHVARKLKFECSKFINYTFKRANNKGTDQTARMGRLVCALNLRMQLRQVFSRHGP